MWQWCRGVPERNGNLLALSEEWWCPYPEATNAAVEAAFASSASVRISIGGRAYTVNFTHGCLHPPRH